MSKRDGSIRVRPVPGEKLVFDVESWSEPGIPQRVDLLAHTGRGQCSCKNWQTKRWPFIRDIHPEVPYGHPESSICRHIEAARNYTLRRTLLTMIADDAKGLIAAFIADPKQVVKCLPTPDAKQHVGEVIRAWPAFNKQWGSDCLRFQVRGRSGKLAEIDQVDNYVRLHPTWEEAVNDSKR